MANSKSWIERIECRVNGDEGQGDIDVWVFVRCPDFFPAQSWYRNHCGIDEPLVPFLARELPNHLSWERSDGPR